MPETIEFNSRVGSDGVLDVRVPLGESEAGAEVVVTIRPVLSAVKRESSPADWHRFVEETYGSCAGLGLDRQPQGEIEKREGLE